MSPLLFNLYAKIMMSEAMEGIEEKIKVGGELVRDVRFADDQNMVADTERGLQRIMDNLNATVERYEMKINIKKTKVMKVSKNVGGDLNITINGNRIEEVSCFKYLGSTMTEDGRCEIEIKTRIALAKEAFNNRKELLTKRFNKVVKKKIVKTLVWITLLYGCETWTLKQEKIRRLKAAEMWMWKRMEKVSYKDEVTNKDVLKRVEEKRRVMKKIHSRKNNRVGHVARGEGMLKEVLEGRMQGKKPQGKELRTKMLSELINRTYKKEEKKDGTY